MLPWGDMMRAVLRLGITPAAFWQLSVREWLWLTATFDVQFGATELQSLMEKYPDGSD